LSLEVAIHSPPRVANRISLGVQQALVVVPVQIALARVFEFVPLGTRAQAVGACVATLSMLLSGFLLGIRTRRALGEGALSESESLAVYLPWRAIFTTSVLLALFGTAGFATPAGFLMVPESTLVPGGMARAIFATNLIVLPSLSLLTGGALLGIHTRSWTVLTALFGFVLLAGLTAIGAYGAQYTSYDAEVVRIYMLVGTTVAALVTGFIVSWIRRRIAFVEHALTALIAGYVIYFIAAVGPKELLSASNVPEEQVLLALVLAPTGSYLCLLVVSGSIAFLLLGGGRFDPGFKYETSVAVRYLRANRHDRFIGTITLISVVGVCLGVTALIVVLSVMSGFEDDLKRKILGAHAHIVLEKHGDDFFEYEDVEKESKEVRGIDTAAAYVMGDAMISSDVGLSGTLVKGIDPTNKDAVDDLRKNIEKGSLEDLLHPDRIPGARPRVPLPSGTSTTGAAGSSSSARAIFKDFAEPVIREPVESGQKVLPGIIIGRELSRTLRAYVGDSVKLVSPVSEEIGPTGPHPKLRRFRVAGIFFSGMYEYDAKFTYVDLKEAQRFFGMRKKATGIEIKVDDVDDTPRILEELKRKVGGYPYTVKDWRMMNKELFSALLLEKLAMFIILTFIVLVASFNIVATLIMIVLEKGKEIAILKSIGASDASIMKIFVVQGLIVGVGGALLGLVLGIGICLFIKRFGVELDQKIFYIERLPVVMDWGEVAAIAIAAVMISYLATIYPAITAARLRPVEGLRDD
jgi:lipoprotein-releasing system permease protein